MLWGEAIAVPRARAEIHDLGSNWAPGRAVWECLRFHRHLESDSWPGEEISEPQPGLDLPELGRSLRKLTPFPFVDRKGERCHTFLCAPVPSPLPLLCSGETPPIPREMLAGQRIPSGAGAGEAAGPGPPSGVPVSSAKPLTRAVKRQTRTTITQGFSQP